MKNYILENPNDLNAIYNFAYMSEKINKIDVAMEIARNTPLATSDALFDHVYAEPPQRMQDQKSDWAIRNGDAQ